MSSSNQAAIQGRRVIRGAERHRPATLLVPVPGREADGQSGRRAASAPAPAGGTSRPAAAAAPAVVSAAASAMGPVGPSNLDAIRRRAYDEGYRAAVAEMEAADAAGRAAQLRRMADALATAADAVQQAREQAVQVAAGEAVELAFQLAEAILERQLDTGDPVAASVRRALALAPEGEDLELRLSPDSCLDPDQLREVAPGVAIKVVADPDVESGGCILTAGACRIDAQIGTAIKRARQVLEDLMPVPSEVAG